MSEAPMYMTVCTLTSAVSTRWCEYIFHSFVPFTVCEYVVWQVLLMGMEKHLEV